MENQKTNISEIFTECISIFEKKNHDYKGAFAKRYSKRGLSYCVDKISEKCDRIEALADEEAEVEDETIEDTLLDLINYSAMTLDLIRQENGND